MLSRTASMRRNPLPWESVATTWAVLSMNEMTAANSSRVRTTGTVICLSARTALRRPAAPG
jgi:hypothetical protein